MRAALVVLLLGISGCTCHGPTKEACAERCSVAGKRVSNWDPGIPGDCSCGDADEASPAVRFCQKCAEQCAPLKAITCKFGNDTWGAGPDVCECERRAP